MSSTGWPQAWRVGGWSEGGFLKSAPQSPGCSLSQGDWHLSSLQTGLHSLLAQATVSSCARAACWYRLTPTVWTGESALARSAGPAPMLLPSTAMTTATPGTEDGLYPTCAQASASWLWWTVDRLAASSTAMPGALWAGVCRRSVRMRARPSCQGSLCPPWLRLPGVARAASWASWPHPPAS